MSLPAILEQAQSTGDVRAVARRHLRLAVPTILPTGARSAIVHDISVGGLLLETDSPLAIGESIAIELPDAKHVEACIVWGSGRFFGCQFTQRISSGHVSASLLKSEPLPRYEERREASGTDDPESLADDRLERGSLSTATRIQIVVAISLALWALIAMAAILLLRSG